jgi:hypothetical protein
MKPAPGGPSVPIQAKSVFGPDPVKSLEASSQSEPKLKLKQFAAITPHMLLMDHSMALACDQ